MSSGRQLEARREALDDRRQARAVRLAGGYEAQRHGAHTLPDGGAWLAVRRRRGAARRVAPRAARCPPAEPGRRRSSRRAAAVAALRAHRLAGVERVDVGPDVRPRREAGPNASAAQSPGRRTSNGLDRPSWSWSSAPSRHSVAVHVGSASGIAVREILVVEEVELGVLRLLGLPVAVEGGGHQASVKRPCCSSQLPRPSASASRSSSHRVPSLSMSSAQRASVPTGAEARRRIDRLLQAVAVEQPAQRLRAARRAATPSAE